MRREYRLAVYLIVLAALPPAQAQHTRPSAHLNLEPAASWDVEAPRGETFEVDFTTDEGTWMSVDISPDGRWLVFDLLGHIYRVPAEGGDAECLTQDSGVALNFHPRFSPDGKHIAFVSDRGGQNNLWVMSADGSEATAVFVDSMSRITSPAWTPDGRAIVAVREFPTYSMHRRSARIWHFPVGQPDQRPTQLVGELSGSQVYWPTPAADGKSVYFMQTTFARQLDGLQRMQHLRRVDIATKAVALVSPTDADYPYRADPIGDMAPELSPDGRWLAFARRVPEGRLTLGGHELRGRTALWIRDLESGAERIVADPIEFDMHQAHGMKNLRVLPGYAWAGDSRSLVFSAGGKLRRVWLDGRQEIVPFSARVHRVASEQARSRAGINDEPLRVRFLRWADVSSDRRHVVFEALGTIWRQPMAEGVLMQGPPVPIDLQPERGRFHFMPRLSPDGKRVAYVSWSDDALGHVWVANADGSGKPRQVSSAPRLYLYPAWSADGKTIHAIRSTDSDAARLARGHAGGFELVRWGPRQRNADVVLAQVAALPFQTGPGGRLYQTVPQGGSYTQHLLAKGKMIPEPHALLVSWDAGGNGAPRPELRFPAASDAVLSPDGRHVAFREGYEIHVAPVPSGQSYYDEEQTYVWRGAERPYPIVKENPRAKARHLSFGGGAYPRWLDADTLIYTSANTIRVVNIETGESQDIQIGLNVPRLNAGNAATIALRNARLVTLGPAGTIEHGTIVVTGRRIVCAGDCPVPSSAYVLDLDGTTIIPGFVDVHAHGGYLAARKEVIPQRLSGPALYLAYGVTTTLDPAATSEIVFPVAEMIEAGRLVGTRTFSTGEYLMPVSPYVGPAGNRDAEALIRRLESYGAISSKIYLPARRDQRQMMTDWARRLGLTVTSEGGDLYYNVGSMLDGHTGFEHPLHYLQVWNDVTQFFAQTNAVYSPTLIVAGGGRWMEEYFQSRSDLWNDPKQRRFMPWPELARRINHAVLPESEYTFPFLAEGVAAILRAGAHAAIGGHGQQWGLDSHWEVWGYSEALAPLEALEMASLGGAYMAGIEADVGSLEAGKLADLMVLDANPLDDIRNTTKIRFVMKDGVLYDDDTLDQLWPGQISYGQPAWLEEDIFRSGRHAIDDDGQAGTAPN